MTLLKSIWNYMGWDDIFAILFFGLGILGFADWIIFIPGGDMVVDLRAEFIGIGITVFIIGNATEARNRAANREAERKRLILQMGSPDNTIAIEAVRQLRSKGWIEDGSLSGVYLSRANLSGADLSKADLSGADLYDIKLNEANLEEADLSGAEMQWSNLKRADLKRANLTKTNLSRAEMSQANLFNAKLNEASLDEASLEDAYLKEAELSEAFLNMANLNGAHLMGANLNLVDLSETYLRGSQYNTDTIWPEGFDPDAAGAIRIE